MHGFIHWIVPSSLLANLPVLVDWIPGGGNGPHQSHSVLLRSNWRDLAANGFPEASPTILGPPGKRPCVARWCFRVVVPYWPPRCPGFVGRRFKGHLFFCLAFFSRSLWRIKSHHHSMHHSLQAKRGYNLRMCATGKRGGAKGVTQLGCTVSWSPKFPLKAPEKPWQLVVQFFPFKLSSFWKPFVLSSNNWIRGHGGFFRVLKLSLPNAWKTPENPNIKWSEDWMSLFHCHFSCSTGFYNKKSEKKWEFIKENGFPPKPVLDPDVEEQLGRCYVVHSTSRWQRSISHPQLADFDAYGGAELCRVGRPLGKPMVSFLRVVPFSSPLMETNGFFISHYHEAGLGKVEGMSGRGKLTSHKNVLIYGQKSLYEEWLSYPSIGNPYNGFI